MQIKKVKIKYIIGFCGILLLLISQLEAQENFETYSQAVDYVQEGDQSVQNREYPQAIFAYEKALEINPNYYEAYKGLVMVFYHTGEYNRIDIVLTRALALGQDFELLAVQADILVRQDKIIEAKTIIDSMLEIQPNFISALLIDIKIMMIQGDLTTALKQVNYLSQLYPNHISVLRLSIFLYRVLEEYARIDDIVEQFDVYSLEDPYLLGELAYIYFYRGMYDEVEQYLNRYLSLYMDKYTLEYFQDLFFLYVSILLSQSKIDLALNYLSRLEEYFSNNDLFYYLKSTAFNLSNNLEEGVKAINKAIDINPFDKRYQIYKEQYFFNYIDSGKLGWFFDFSQNLTQSRINQGNVYQEKWDYFKTWFNIGMALKFDPNNIFNRLRYVDLYQLLNLPEMAYLILNSTPVLSLDETLQKNKEEYQSKQLKYQYLFRQSLPYRWDLSIEDLGLLNENRETFNIGIFDISNPNKKHLFTFHHIYLQYLSFIHNSMQSPIRLKYIPSQTYTYTDILTQSRSQNLDFFFTFDFQWSLNEVLMTLDVYTGNTGLKMASKVFFFREENKEDELILAIIEFINKEYLLFGTILQVDYQEILVNLGRVHFINEGDEFVVVKNYVRPNIIPESPYFGFNNEDIIGVAKVKEVSDLVSTMVVENKFFYSSPHIGYQVYLSRPQKIADSSNYQVNPTIDINEEIQNFPIFS